MVTCLFLFFSLHLTLSPPYFSLSLSFEVYVYDVNNDGEIMTTIALSVLTFCAKYIYISKAVLYQILISFLGITFYNWLG